MRFISALFTFAFIHMASMPLAYGAEQGHAPNILTIAIEDSWPPYADHNGRGYSRDILERALELSQTNYIIQVEPYARALYLTKTGSVNACLNVTRQASTEAVYHFGEVPLLIAEASVFTPKNAQKKLESLHDIPDGYRVGIITDYEYGDLFEKEKLRFDLSKVRTQEQLINMLKTGRLDAMIMFDEVYKYTMAKMNLDEDVFYKSFLNHSSDIYVAFNKDDPNSATYSALLDKGLRRLKTTQP
jgi:polar amino acid transport system substrate-binding protein